MNDDEIHGIIQTLNENISVNTTAIEFEAYADLLSAYNEYIKISSNDDIIDE